MYSLPDFTVAYTSGRLLLRIDSYVKSASNYVPKTPTNQSKMVKPHPRNRRISSQA